MDRLRNTGHWEAFSKLLGQEVQVAVLASPPKWSFKLLCSFTTHHPIYLGSWPQQFVDVLMLRWPFLLPQLQSSGTRYRYQIKIPLLKAFLHAGPVIATVSIIRSDATTTSLLVFK